MQIVGTIVDDNDNLICIRAYREDIDKFGNMDVARMMEAFKRDKNAIIGFNNQMKGIEFKDGQFRGTNGALSRYTKYHKSGKVITEAYVIIAEVVDEKGNIGYKVITPKEEIKKWREQDIIKEADRIKLANGKIVEKDNRKFVSAIVGEFPQIKIGVSKAHNIGKRSYMDRSVAKRVYQCSTENSRLNEVDEKTGMTIGDKIASATIAIKEVKPFYYAALSTMDKFEVAPSENESLDTMGVAMNRLYFNSEFVKEITKAELIFVLLHEICHVAMSHESRKGGRDHNTWNIACDLYINKLLAEELGITERNRLTTIRGRTAGGAPVCVEIAMPENICYEDSVDTRKDTPESIYMELINENNNNGDGNQQNGEGNQQNGEQGGGGRGTENSKTFRGSVLNNEESDMVSDEKSATMTEEQKRQEQKSNMRRIEQVNKQMNRGKGIGSGSTGLERYIEEAMVEPVDWRKIVANVARKCNDKYSTFTRPDRRFLSRGKVLPGYRKVEGNELEDIVIAVDTSGSVDEKMLGTFMGQVNALLSQFKVKSTLLYWDSSVQAEYEFKNYKELIRLKPVGGGGTEPSCIYKYLENNEKYKKGLQKQPELVVIFTDGRFYNAGLEKYKAKWGRKTVFVITDEDYRDGFKAPIGITAPLKGGRQ